MIVLRGRVESGKADASRWLSKFHEAYSRKVGMRIFPGTLNVRLTEPFDWYSPELRSALIEFPGEEYGGERDVLMLPCVITSHKDQPAYLWSTVNAVLDPERRTLVELIAPVGLREKYGLVDGDHVKIALP